MEKLKVQQVQEIVHRLRQGQSERSIVRDLGCGRETVRRYGNLARAHGYLSESSPLPSLADLETATTPLYAPRRSNLSSVEPYRALVEDMLNKGVEGTAIHRCLCRNHDYKGSYGSILRFLRTLRPSCPDAVVRIETAAGKQAQVDFGTVGDM